MQELAVLASRTLTTQRQFTAIADNVANVNTSGFRKLEMNFREVISQPKGKPTASYVADRALLISHVDGPMQSTGNPLDIALSGKGFFAIDVNGVTQYTRRGQFVLNNEGTLVTPEGFPVLDNSGAPIQFSPQVKNIRIATDGTISTEEGQLAQMGVFQFSAADEKLLQRAGNTAFIPQLGAVAAPVDFGATGAPQIRQGFTESSNVNAVEEMVDMETVSRAYQQSVTLARSLEDLEQRAIRNLGGGQ
jgi:flagellar basal-body rod protein FlgF